MDISEIRRINLEGLITEAGGLSKLASKIDMDSNYISQVRNGHRNLGPRLSRKIETNYGLREFYLDQLHSAHGSSVIDQLESIKDNCSPEAAKVMDLAIRLMNHDLSMTYYLEGVLDEKSKSLPTEETTPAPAMKLKEKLKK